MASYSDTEKAMDNCFIKPNFQIEPTRVFTNKNGLAVSAFPMILDFRKLIELSSDCVLPGVTNRDLLHAVVAMYNVSLSEMTPDMLYDYVCDKWARTIVLIQDLAECCERLNERIKKKRDARKIENIEEEDAEHETEDNNEKEGNESDEKDVYVEAERVDGVFDEVFSDTEDDDDEEDDAKDEDEDFSLGIGRFVKNVILRREARLTSDLPVQSQHIGIENRLLGCVTFEKKYVKSARVVHLTLLSVRRRYRKFGIGSYLLSKIQDGLVVGDTEAIVVHADNEAIPFFTKYNFTDDVILNSRWSELAEQFTNCTLMCYLPSFSGHNSMSHEQTDSLILAELDKELAKWRSKSLEAYQAQVSCMFRYREEMQRLAKSVEDQKKLIDVLISENGRMHKDYLLDIDHAGGEGHVLTDAINQLEIGEDSTNPWTDVDIGEENENSPMFLSAHPPNAITLMTHKKTTTYDHAEDLAYFYDITRRFKQAMLSAGVLCEVSSIAKTQVSAAVVTAFEMCLTQLHDPSNTIDLYFCAHSESHLQRILSTGFSQSDIQQSQYGEGLYFSTCPHIASRHSPLGQLLLARVGVGKTLHVTIPHSNPLPLEGYDSVKATISGDETESGESTPSSRYIISSLQQAIPLSVILYKSLS